MIFTGNSLMYIVQKLTKELENMQNVAFGYLFGSFANGTERTSSDVDVALFLVHNSLDARLQIIYELSKKLQREVDLIVLNDVKNVYLLESILNKGILLKENEQRIDFELAKQHEILDYKSFKKIIDAA